jgi:hypothetical protein
MSKLAYRPFALVFSIVAGMLASAATKKVWTRVSGQEDLPKAKESAYGWKPLLSVAVLQGALMGLMKAVADRGGARAFEKVTGSWPGD